MVEFPSSITAGKPNTVQGTTARPMPKRNNCQLNVLAFTGDNYGLLDYD